MRERKRIIEDEEVQSLQFAAAPAFLGFLPKSIDVQITIAIILARVAATIALLQALRSYRGEAAEDQPVSPIRKPRPA